MLPSSPKPAMIGWFARTIIESSPAFVRASGSGIGATAIHWPRSMRKSV
jgi:hypothetical protein